MWSKKTEKSCALLSTCASPSNHFSLFGSSEVGAHIHTVHTVSTSIGVIIMIIKHSQAVVRDSYATRHSRAQALFHTDTAITRDQRQDGGRERGSSEQSSLIGERNRLRTDMPFGPKMHRHRVRYGPSALLPPFRVASRPERETRKTGGGSERERESCVSEQT